LSDEWPGDEKIDKSPSPGMGEVSPSGNSPLEQLEICQPVIPIISHETK
jgi:hypothetical protein